MGFSSPNPAAVKLPGVGSPHSSQQTGSPAVISSLWPSRGLAVCLFLHQEPAIMVACLEPKKHTPGLHVLETEMLSCLRIQMRIVKGGPLFSRSRTSWEWLRSTQGGIRYPTGSRINLTFLGDKEPSLLLFTSQTQGHLLGSLPAWNRTPKKGGGGRLRGARHGGGRGGGERGGGEKEKKETGDGTGRVLREEAKKKVTLGLPWRSSG